MDSYTQFKQGNTRFDIKDFNADEKSFVFTEKDILSAPTGRGHLMPGWREVQIFGGEQSYVPDARETKVLFSDVH